MREMSLGKIREHGTRDDTSKSERSSRSNLSVQMKLSPPKVDRKHKMEVSAKVPQSPQKDASISPRDSKSPRKDGSQKSAATQVLEPPSQKGTKKEPRSEVSTSCQTTALKSSTSLTTVTSTDELPQSYYKFINVKVELTQIAEVDGVVPNNMREFLEMIESATGEVTLGVIRPWNVRPPTPQRMAPVYTLKKHCYLIVEPQTMGAFAFLAIDRIVDVDSDLIPNQVNMVALKNRIRAVQERDGYCTFLVERPSSLHHTTNPSCIAMKTTVTATKDVEMGDDAVEIGAREAFKHTLAKNKHRQSPVYGPPKPNPATIEAEHLLTAVENDTTSGTQLVFLLPVHSLIQIFRGKTIE
ncbi:hypothetical protein KIN20_033633 [Parelaphostrongylus tenuis]|uniref:Uncharacterized protein n=1 Tax=Parelaphostrongylus tenuis TaxID=148309 RepID=A0AAD5WJD5_PARTN|nr:hypothetical protein KIN20_033633 [Parelaphostrongylus tenuis]